MAHALGCMFVGDGAVAQSIPVGTIQKVSGFVDSYATGTGPDVVNDQLWISDPGDYIAIAQLSFSGTANTLFTFHIYVNDVVSVFGTHRKLSGGDAGSCSILGVLKGLKRGDSLDIRVNSDNVGGASITLIDASFLIFELED